MKQRIKMTEEISSFLAPGKVWNATLECGHVAVLEAHPSELEGDKYIDCEECDAPQPKDQ